MIYVDQYTKCSNWTEFECSHYCDVIMGAVASQITSLTIVYSTIYSDADQRKHQSSASLAFVRRIHRGPVNSLHKWPVTRKKFLFDDVIMLAWKMVSGMIKNAKISNRSNMRICNELWCWFSKASKVFDQWIWIPNIKSIKGIFLDLSQFIDLLMNVARKCVKRSLKTEFWDYKKPGTSVKKSF